jgi:hypothetical protein
VDGKLQHYTSSRHQALMSSYCKAIRFWYIWGIIAGMLPIKHLLRSLLILLRISPREQWIFHVRTLNIAHKMINRTRNCRRIFLTCKNGGTVFEQPVILSRPPILQRGVLQVSDFYGKSLGSMLEFLFQPQPSATNTREIVTFRPTRRLRSVYRSTSSSLSQLAIKEMLGM